MKNNKTFCRICNEELNNSHKVTISIDTINVQQFELCLDCCTKFKELIRTDGLMNVISAYLE